MKAEKPYITKRRVVIDRSYNPKFGDCKVCGCGHPYYRHFDSYDEMRVCGCKYCDCQTWHPIKNKDDTEREEINKEAEEEWDKKNPNKHDEDIPL